MTDNPLMTRQPHQAKSLDGHCHWLNGLNWVRASGVPYHISERDKPDGGTERFLNRAA